MTHDTVTHTALLRLIEEDAVGQLRRRDGLMATLGSEDGVLKLDWVDAVGRLVAEPTKLDEVEAEARNIRTRGIRHIIWAGMGGSVLAVRVLHALGFCDGPGDHGSSQRQEEAVAIHPLDSTDPAALNAIVRTIASAKHLEVSPVPESVPAQTAFLHLLFNDVMMIGVSMGMTSEEPITHLTWFTELLERAGLRPAEHLLVMTLPGSYLDAFAREHNAPRRPLQLDGGTGTGGRMSAPGTRVFLLPLALYLTGLSGNHGQLRSVLQLAWAEYNLDMAAISPAEHVFVRLAAALSAASADGACRMMVRMPEDWRALVPWLEQLMEESLGKGGKGIVVFDDQPLNPSAPCYQETGMLRVHVVTDALQEADTSISAQDQRFVLSQPALASNEPHARLAALTASFLGWQLSMALYGYLHGIHFAGQPAVEDYKARARALRTRTDGLRVALEDHSALNDGILTLLVPAGSVHAVYDPTVTPLASAFASVLQDARTPDDSQGQRHERALEYLDVTVNGEADARLISLLDEHSRALGNRILGIPVKLRRAPAAYHSTEQSEMDGPPYLVSLRLVSGESERSLLGHCTDAFLHAQAVSTWQAMVETGRTCCLLIIGGLLSSASEQLEGFFFAVEQLLRNA